MLLLLVLLFPLLPVLQPLPVLLEARLHEENDAARPHVHRKPIEPARARQHLGGHVVLLPARSLRRQRDRPPVGVLGDAKGQPEVDDLHDAPFGEKEVFQAQVSGCFFAK